MTQNGTGLLRPRFFDRQQLRAADLMAGQDYLRERLRRHNRFLHGFGVVCGAEVTAAGTEENPWLVSIGEGYVVTPGGDEVYLPAMPTHDICEGVEACLGTTLPCPDPTDPGESSGAGVLRIIRASINPPGKDIRTEYNKEWVDLMLLEDTNLNGYEVQHTINPGTPDEGLRRYYRFTGGGTRAAGTIIRIHSGAAANDPAPSPGVLHRYFADPGEVGNWRLNNEGDTIRVLNAEGEVVDTQSFLPVSYFPVSSESVYLVACPGEEETCPQPTIPVACQPPGGVYEFSRVCDTYQLQIRCDLPPSHQDRLSCDDLEAIVCGNQHPPFPGMRSDDDNCVVLATIHILDDDITLFIDDLTDRRLLLSESLLLNYLQCQCDDSELPVAAFLTRPDSGPTPLNVQFTDRSSGIIESWNWSFGDGSTSSQRNPSHVYQAAGVYTATLTITGPGGVARAADSITVTAQAPNAAFLSQPSSGQAPLNVQFTDQSSGNITSWSWSFGDGGSSNQRNPSHVYQAAGVFTVTLTVTGPGGTDTATRSITVTGPQPPIGSINSIIPNVVQGSTTIQVPRNVLITGTGLNNASEVQFQDPRVLNVAILSNSSTSINLAILLNRGNGVREVEFWVLFADGRPDIRSEDFDVSLRINYSFIIPFDNLISESPELALNTELIANELNVDPGDVDLVAAAEHDLTDIHNVGPGRRQRFEEAGVQNIITVATMPVEEIMNIAEVSESQAEGIQSSARQLMMRTQ